MIAFPGFLHPIMEFRVSHNKPTVEYMTHLDGIRAFAVGGVILEHWASGLPGPLPAVVESFDLGWLGR